MLLCCRYDIAITIMITWNLKTYIKQLNIIIIFYWLIATAHSCYKFQVEIGAATN